MFGSKNRLVINGGTYIHHSLQSGTRGIDRLLAATAPAAFHNSRERFDPPKCHPRTREAVLKKIMEWVQRKIGTEAFVMWLYGAAGAGKSAIAQTIAEICYKEGLLLATFFFSRSDSQRNNTERLVASIAYQMVLAIPSSRAFVEAAVEDDPLIFTRSLEAQFATLVTRPLEQLREAGVFADSSPPALIILDGLDECMDGTRIQLLDIIPAVVAQSCHLLFFIASRAEQDISTAIRFGIIEQGLTQISLDDGYQSDEDIERFLLDKFNEIKRRHPLRSQIPSDWPSTDTIATLVIKASWQFIYASTVAIYVSSIRHQPTTRLDIILGLHPPRSENDTPFSQLDALYTHIISSTEDQELTLRVISACQLSPTKTLRLVGKFLGLHKDHLRLCLNSLAPIIKLTKEHSGPLRFMFLHASLGDFLFDKSRSRHFYVDAQAMHAELAHWSVDIILKGEIVPFTLEDEPWSYCSRHLSRARLTPQLINDIHSISFQEMFKIRCRNHSLFAFDFLSCIKDLRFDGVELLYTQYRTIYDQGLMYYFDEMSLTSLEIIHFNNPLSFSQVPCGPLLLPESRDAVGRIFKVPRSNDSIFYNFNRHDYGETYVQDFLNDKKRSGRYAMDDSHYTISAERCIQYLLNPSDIAIQGARCWAGESKKRPWFCRKRCTSVVSSVRAHRGYQLREDVDRHNPKPKSMSLLAVDIALTVLPSLLEKAALDSTSLVTLCRKLTTRRLSFSTFPSKSRAVQRAIGRYLSKVKAQRQMEVG